MKRGRLGVLAAVGLVAAGCGITADRMPRGNAPAGLKQITFEIVAKDNRCQPSVLAADREGRSVLLKFEVTSVGKTHRFLIPDLDVRTTVPAGTQVTIPVIADRGGIYSYACTSSPWFTPLTSKGRLAVK